MDEIIIYTDGACSGNPGPGGFAGIIVNKAKNFVCEVGGGFEHTTNNKMEMLAVIHSLQRLETLNMSGNILVYSDSSYVIKGMSEWIFGWIKKGWRKADGKEVLNKELWLKLLDFSNKYKIKWVHVRGHADNPGNNRCDEIAVAYSKNKAIELYSGDSLNYKIKI